MRLARPLAPQPRDEPLAAAVAVDVCGVDEVDAGVDGRVEGGDRLRIVDRAPGAADGPGAEADRRNGDIRPAEMLMGHRRPGRSGSGAEGVRLMR